MKWRLSLIILSLTLVLCSAVMVTGVEAQTGGCSTTHIVQRGETLYRIALQYRTSIADIQARNSISNPNMIYAGQRLCIAGGFVPPTTPVPDNNPPSGQGRVTTFLLNVRSGPGTQYPVLRQLRFGQIVSVVGRNADSSWYLVAAEPGGRKAWVFARYLYTPNPQNLQVVSDETAPYSAYVMLVSDATTYSGPTTLTAVPPYELFTGTTVLVTGRNSTADWFQVRTGFNGSAWLRLDAFPAALARFEFPITG